MAIKPIDVWNIETFDSGLIKKLWASAELIRNYMTAHREWFHERHVLGNLFAPENGYGHDFVRLVEQELMVEMDTRTIRAWHYTRLFDEEVQKFCEEGIYLSTLGKLRQRLDDRIAAGNFTAEIAISVFEESPFHHQSSRSNKFWMVSEPVPIDDSGVSPLIRPLGRRVRIFLA